MKSEIRLGIIGYGSRLSGLGDTLYGQGQGAVITCIADTDHEQVRERLQQHGIDPGTVRLYRDAAEMLDREPLDGVMVGTRCSLHARMACAVLERNLPLYLEKPVATSLDDLRMLKRAHEVSRSQVVVSFPLRLTAQVRLARQLVESGEIGRVEHVQAVNNVPYGGVYYHSWYRDENETGGLFLQKATHDFDYINAILGMTPVAVCAMKSKQVFRGDKPAGLRCPDCEAFRTCPESPHVLAHLKDEVSYGDLCCFAVDTGNEDSGSALLRYESGMHVSYSQNFFVRKSAAARGARFMGYRGTLEFDWVTDELKVIHHDSSRVDTYRFQSSGSGHSGGDSSLASNFLQVIQGKEPSASPLEAGLVSALTCLKARQSAETDRFEPIRWE